VTGVSIPGADEYNENAPQEEYVPPVQQEEQAPVVDELQQLRDKLAEMEAKLSGVPESQVKVEYHLPNEVKEILENPGMMALLNEDFSNKTILDLIKDDFSRRNPWATTDRHIETHLRRQFPDIDFDIPENLGLAQEDFDALAWQAEGYRNELLSAQHELKGKLDAVKNPVPAQFDTEGYQRQYEQKVNTDLSGLTPMELTLGIPGYEYPKVDPNKIRDIAYSEQVPLSLDVEGNVWPNMKAAAAIVELEHLKSQIPAMLEAARRAAPKEAVEAINRTLNNQVPQNNVAPIDTKQAVGRQAPSMNGMRIVGVQSNF